MEGFAQSRRFSYLIEDGEKIKFAPGLTCLPSACKLKAFNSKQTIASAKDELPEARPH
jgi:hypothetical protein